MPIDDGLKPDSDAPVSQVPSNQIFQNLQELLSSPELLEFLAKSKSNRRPDNASKLSTFSYYKEQFGLEMKIVLDNMIETEQNQIYMYSDFPELLRSTLYARINQSLNYVLNELDIDGKYRRIKDKIIIDRKSNPAGIMILLVKDKLLGKAFQPRPITDSEFTDQYKDQINTFLNDETTKVLHLKNLALTTGQMEDVNSAYSNLPHLFTLVTEREIKIVKTENENP